MHINPPGGDFIGVCHAVPMRVAELTQRLWKEYQESYTRKLRQARHDRTAQVLLAREA